MPGAQSCGGIRIGDGDGDWALGTAPAEECRATDARPEHGWLRTVRLPPPRRPRSLSLVRSPRTRLCSVQLRSASGDPGSLQEASVASGMALTGPHPGAEGGHLGRAMGAGRAAGSQERGLETVLGRNGSPHGRGTGD